MGKKKKLAPKPNPVEHGHGRSAKDTATTANAAPSSIEDAEKDILKKAVEIVKRLKEQDAASNTKKTSCAHFESGSSAGNDTADVLIGSLAEAIGGNNGSVASHTDVRNRRGYSCGDTVSLSSSPKLPLWSPSSDIITSACSPATPLVKAGQKAAHNPAKRGQNSAPHAHFNLPPEGSADSAKATKAEQVKKKQIAKSKAQKAASPGMMSMSFSERLYESIGPPAVANATQQLVKPKRNWIIFGLLIIIVGLVYHQKPEMPAGLVVDDPKRPGVLFNKSTIKIRRPVAMIPGFVTSALELWENDECAAPLGPSGTLFRERMFGPQMLFNLLKRPQCYMRQFALHPQRFGDDPEPFDPTLGRRIRARPAGWLDSGDYFIAGFWVWAKLIRSLADIGYDPNTMLLFPFDWRLNSELAEKRDGYFHRLRDSLQEMYRISNNTKIVVVSHSYGGAIKRDFFHWCEQFEPGWTNRYIHSSVFIGAPMLGVTKALSAVVSGEMRDMTQLPSVPRHILNAYIPRMWRTETFRSWPCLEAMLPRGCDAMWPNVMSLFNQSLTLRASDAFEVVETIAEQAGHTCLSDRIKKSKKTRTQLPNLPNAPDMKAFVFYGTGLATESGYAYTIDEDDVGGADAIATKEKGRLSLGPADIMEFAMLFSFNRPFPSLFSSSSSDESFTSHHDHNKTSIPNSHLPHSHVARGGEGGNKQHVYKPPSFSKLEAAIDTRTVKNSNDDKSSTVENEGKMQGKEPVTDGGGSAGNLLTWQEYVSSLSSMVKEVTAKMIDDGIDAVLNMRQGSSGQTDTNKANNVDQSKKASPEGKQTTSDDSSREADNGNKSNRRKKKGSGFSRVASLAHGVIDLPPGSLWRPAFLGSRTTGNALMVDTTVDTQVSDRIRSLYKCKSLRGGNDHDGSSSHPTSNASIDGNASSKNENINRDTNITFEELANEPAVCGYFGPHGRGGGDMKYHQGVILGPGDATVPLISLGFMARSPQGFKKDVGTVVTKEFVHLHTAEAHEKLLAVRAERLRRLKETSELRKGSRKKRGAARGDEGGLVEGKPNIIPDLGITTQKVAAESVLPARVVSVDEKMAATHERRAFLPNANGGSPLLSSFSFTDYLKKLAEINVSRLLETDTSELEAVISGAANTLSTATDVIVEQMKESVKAVLDVRGGKASADHVDLIGNYELISDVLNIVTGNEEKVTERIFTDIDERIEDLPCYK